MVTYSPAQKNCMQMPAPTAHGASQTAMFSMAAEKGYAMAQMQLAEIHMVCCECGCCTSACMPVVAQMHSSVMPRTNALPAVAYLWFPLLPPLPSPPALFRPTQGIPSPFAGGYSADDPRCQQLLAVCKWCAGRLYSALTPLHDTCVRAHLAADRQRCQSRRRVLPGGSQRWCCQCARGPGPDV